MRIKLNFIVDESDYIDNDYYDGEYLVNSLYRKIIFPINEVVTVGDLKIKINKFIQVNSNNQKFRMNACDGMRKTKDYVENKKLEEKSYPYTYTSINIKVENLFIDNFLLMDEFTVRDVLNNDDELK